jgi:hypothetical protein
MIRKYVIWLVTTTSVVLFNWSCDEAKELSDTGPDGGADTSTNGSWVECAPDADKPSVFIFAETETDDYILVFQVNGGGGCQDLTLFFGIAENMRQYNVTQCQDGGTYIVGFEMNGSEAVLSYTFDFDTEGNEIATDVEYTYNGEIESAQILDYLNYDTSSFEFYCIE